MLQQTRMEVVLPYFARFLERFPTVSHLAAASDEEVTAAWSGLGYYRRARMLRDGAAVVVKRYNGRVPSSVAELLTIPGIGRYTAGAIASIAFEAREPIVDGNVSRVLARIGGKEKKDYWADAEKLVNASISPRALNQSLMELGALVCTPRNPSCLLCPLRDDCRALLLGRADEIPRPKARKEPRALAIPLYVIRDRKGRVLMRRESGALMNALYHLPHGNALLLPDGVLRATETATLGAFRHTVTHRRIEFTVFAARARRARGYEWVETERLSELPHPSYVAKALSLARRAPAAVRTG
jgi:A/G-specific adenine glycosylase